MKYHLTDTVTAQGFQHVGTVTPNSPFVHSDRAKGKCVKFLDRDYKSMLLCTPCGKPVPQHTSHMAVASQALGDEGEKLGRARVDDTCYT